MGVFQSHYKGLPAASEGDTYHEQWVAGTYIVSGVFQRRCYVTVEQLDHDIPQFFQLLRQNKRAIWPRGICGYYAIPIYTADRFQQTVIDWVHRRPQYKYAMWYEPVLYDRVHNIAQTRASWGRNGEAFRAFLFGIISAALDALRRHEGHAELPRVNID
jgi:hypothetical protein